MPGGLVARPAGQPAGSGSAASPYNAGLSASTTTSSGHGQTASHLDSWFQSHAWTREDVLLMVAVAQLLITVASIWWGFDHR